MEEDKEVKAISLILAALQGLGDKEREGVLNYVLGRFGISSTFKKEPSSFQSLPSIKSSGVDFSLGNSFTDIRALKDQKQPKSAIQMVVLVAFYLQEVAGAQDRKESINSDDVEKYFKQASFKLPAGKNGAADTLNNAKNAGYLESVTKGEFKMNPVGYNLIAYGLPAGKFGNEKKKVIKKKGIKAASKKK